MFSPCEVVDAPRFERKEMRALDGAAAERYVRAFYDDRILVRQSSLRLAADFDAASYWG